MRANTATFGQRDSRSLNELDPLDDLSPINSEIVEQGKALAAEVLAVAKLTALSVTQSEDQKSWGIVDAELTTDKLHLLDDENF